MASQPLALVELRRSTSRDQNELSPVEQTALDFCRDKANKGEVVTRSDIAIAIGSQNLWGGTAPGVLNRLEQKGHITRTFYQRGLQVCIRETGECTAPPASRATHWRNRTEDVPSPPIQSVRRAHLTAASIIEHEARKADIAIPDFLQELVWNGLELWLEKQENEG